MKVGGCVQVGKVGIGFLGALVVGDAGVVVAHSLAF